MCNSIISRILPPTVFLVFLLAQSCDIRTPGPMPPAREDTCRARFSIHDPGTRATGVSPSDEERVARWALYVFSPAGELIASGTSPSRSDITVTVPAGTCRACAVVNYPQSGTGSFNLTSITTESALASTVAFLADNVPDGLEMYGSETFTLPTGTDAKTIPVERILSKVGVRKVTVRLANAALAGQTFTLKGIWIDNVPSRTLLGSDCPYQQLGEERSLWYNAMDWHGSGSCTDPSCPDALLGDRGIGVTIPQGGSYETEHWFYVIPNATPSPSDSRTAAWSRRCTRLVIQAAVGTKTTYYAVTLPGLRRNNSYTIDEAVITRLGSDDPEQEVPGAIELVFSTSDPSWDGPRRVTEAS